MGEYFIELMLLVVGAIFGERIRARVAVLEYVIHQRQVLDRIEKLERIAATEDQHEDEDKDK